MCRRYRVAAIETSPTLVSVDLEKCALGPEGTEVIGYAIRENDNLQALNMSANRLDTKACIVLAESLRRNEQLRILMLRHNPVGFEARAPPTVHAYHVHAALTRPSFKPLTTSKKHAFPLGRALS